MQKYTIVDYQKGFEEDQARIGIDVARKWIWPYAYSQQDLVNLHTRSDFDPDTRHYCFVGDEMVGYMFSIITATADNKEKCATLDFPRMIPGHEAAAELLINKAFETLRRKGVTRVTGRVTTMCPGDVRLAEKTGFSIYSWGYKVYYTYEMGWGKLNVTENTAMEINPDKDLDAISEIASIWYKRPPKWCHTHMTAWHKAGVITHVGMRKQGKWIAGCLVASNDVRSSTAAIYYIFTPDEDNLTPMLVKVVNMCVDYGAHNVIADLINEHRQYEPIYQSLGFNKVAEWALCEKVLM